jgi:hypothetical protein
MRVPSLRNASASRQPPPETPWQVGRLPDSPAASPCGSRWLRRKPSQPRGSGSWQAGWQADLPEARRPSASFTDDRPPIPALFGCCRLRQPLRCACLAPNSGWMRCIPVGVASPQRPACHSSGGVLFQARWSPESPLPPRCRSRRARRQRAGRDTTPGRPVLLRPVALNPGKPRDRRGQVPPCVDRLPGNELDYRVVR